MNWFLGDDGSAWNHAKVTAEIDYLPNGTPEAKGLGYLNSPGHDQWAFKLQFQLWL